MKSMKKIKSLLMVALAACTVLTCACRRDVPDTGDTDTTGSEASSVSDTDTETDQTDDGGTDDDDIKDEDIVMASTYQKDFHTHITFDGEKYTTESRLVYTASGHNGFSNDRFAIEGKDQTVSLDFNGTLVSDFNKIILCYEATTPIKACATYRCDNTVIEDTFYLEEGKHTFSCLNSNYLDGKIAQELIGLSFTAIRDAGEIGLYDVELGEQAVYDDPIYYLENNAYKLGIKLSWGGGICYLEDKQDSTYGLRNLINQYDTGRLVQQSYYGTPGESDYTPGEYNGSHWTYNPVQGGDVYQNHSRLIEIEVKERSVYIKAQPQDWSLNGQLTPSYMENVYTLYSDRIRVDNRFMDFGYFENNACRDQELPAFYTVSYFDTFVYYGGTDSWTDDTLSYGRDLPFWGSNTSERNRCLFPLRMSNRETWCAWVNDKSDYGIGLYVPNVDFFLAGRYEYDGSKSSMALSTNYVAPLNKLEIVSGDAIEYSYIITTGSVDEMRETFKTYKDFAANESLHENYTSYRIPDESHEGMDFDFTSAEGSVGNVTSSNATDMTYDASSGATKLTATGADVQIYLSIPSDIDAKDYQTMTIEYMIPASNLQGPSGFEVFLCTGDTVNPDASKSVKGSYVCDGVFHTVDISLEDPAFWQGTVNGVRFDYLNLSEPGDTVYIKSITFH